MLRLLCERADVLVNKIDYIGGTALYRAFWHGHVECIRILLDVGKADIDAPSSVSRTALDTAACYGCLEAAALLIERGAKVNLVSDQGKTPLDWAHVAIQNISDMIAFL